MSKVIIIDGYLDEPSCLGVPPYIAPQIRYIYGALKDAGIKKEAIFYRTIDQLREKNYQSNSLKQNDLLVIVAGSTVPGKYLGGKPITIKEINQLGAKSNAKSILSGPITTCNFNFNHIDYLDSEIVGVKAYNLITNENIKAKNINSYLAKWSQLGAEVTTRHPNFPKLVCEIETYRGCLRNSHCDFCSEGLKEITYQRPIKDIINEVKRLYELGNRYFRLGCQTDLLLYQAQTNNQKNLKPNPKAIKKLYQGIREVAPKLKVLHMDNINPATIADYPKLSKQALKAIVKHNTSGDIAAFGLESADPKVLKANNIGTNAEKTFKAIEILNQVGSVRKEGVPKLLPGINLLHGLSGERKKTRKLNYHFLKRILAKDLLLRRINIRQVNPLGDYERKKAYNQYQFKKYKEKINKKINQPMLAKVFPKGTLLKEVIIEKNKGKIAFGRQLGTYPILIGIPGDYKLGEVIDVKVIDYGYRSITGLCWPFKINQASIEELEALPGIGKNRAFKLFSAKNITSLADIKKKLPNYDVKQLEGIID